MTEQNTHWLEFLDATRDVPPRPNLLRALKYLPETGCALDLGCGAGHDTLALLRHGLQVTAVDLLPEAVDLTIQKAEQAGLESSLQALCCRFEDYIPGKKYDLVYSGFSLPFCPPKYFPETWKRLCLALAPGGLLAVQLFGNHDEWAESGEHPEITFHSRDDVEKLSADFEKLHFEEVERPGWTATGKRKYWHVFHLLFRNAPHKAV